MESKLFFRDKIHKHLQMFAGNFGIEPIFISWDIAIFVIFASVEILLISAMYAIPRENEISFYAHRMRFDKKYEKIQYIRQKMVFILCKIAVFCTFFVVFFVKSYSSCRNWKPFFAWYIVFVLKFWSNRILGA